MRIDSCYMQRGIIQSYPSCKSSNKSTSHSSSFWFSVYQTKLQDSGAVAQTNIITRRKEQNNSSSCMVANVMDANVHPILDGRVLDVVDASIPHGVHADCRDFRVVR